MAITRIKTKNNKQKSKIHSNRIKSILREANMTQQELADLTVDGNKAHLSRIINGKKQHISLAVAAKIAKALKKQIEEVFICK